MSLSLSKLVYNFEPKTIPHYYIGEILKKEFPDKFILSCPEQHVFDIYRVKEFCNVTKISPLEHLLKFAPWYKEGKIKFPYREHVGWHLVKYQNIELQIVLLTDDNGTCWIWIISSNQTEIETFLNAYKKWDQTQTPTDIQQFSLNTIDSNKDLRKEIKSVSFEDLCLEKSLIDKIKNDFQSFVSSEEIYKKYKMPWKRGVILTGPPGNGKTGIIKALINWSNFRCLYANNFTNCDNRKAANCVSKFFKELRKNTPCIGVLEDLDSLIDDSIKSSFLNELDGFENNDGIFLIATTNYPEKIDAALLQRPSRFDRVYRLDLPTLDLRKEYFRRWNVKVELEQRILENELDEIAEKTNGLSFASLKEIWLSSMLTWIQNPVEGYMIDCLRNNIDAIKCSYNQEKRYFNVQPKAFESSGSNTEDSNTEKKIRHILEKFEAF